ncbi:MAG: DUF1819 family protein [Thermotogota bacterium]|nr:DUF1819 family protein [Thermotogota bacterium]
MNEKKPEKPESNKYKINKNTLTSSLTYRMSYVLGGLYLQESLIVADEYIKNKNWEKTKATILTENRLQTNMKRSSQRMYREIALRLKTLSETQLNLLLSGTAEEKRQILWLACCKSYRLIFEVATELLYEKLSSGEKHLSIPDYEAFYTKKALKSEKLQKLTETTRRKIKNVTFKIMREADIITKDNEILPQLLSKKIQRVISEENPQLLEVYP